MCNHEETVFDTGRIFCVNCGIQQKGPVLYVEPTFAKDTCTDFSKQKYFVKAVSVALGEESITPSEKAILEQIALQAVAELGRAPPKLYLKRFALKRDRDQAVLCRQHYPMFFAMTGHPLPKITSNQRRILFATYEQVVNKFNATRHLKKKNISCREVINRCLQDFEVQKLLLVPPPQAVALCERVVAH
jgi:hypothetical protein